MRPQHIKFLLCITQPLEVHQQRFGIRLLAIHHALHHRLELRFYVVALVDHVRDLRRVAREDGVVGSAHQFHENAEQLERIGRADDQIVIGVAAGVEVKPAEPLFVQQVRDNRFDVDGLRVMPQVHQHLRFVAQGLAVRKRHAPVGQIGEVKARLE